VCPEFVADPGERVLFAADGGDESVDATERDVYVEKYDGGSCAPAEESGDGRTPRESAAGEDFSIHSRRRVRLRGGGFNGKTWGEGRRGRHRSI
jgi:hypothetical protein